MPMHPVDIKAVLETMVVLVDSREQPSNRAKQRYEALEAPFKRCTLSYGDYAANFIMPSGNALYDDSTTIQPLAVIERKMGLDELEQCFTRGRERFEREFARATDSGADIYLLVENATWENLINGRYRSKMNPKAFLASLTAWMVRYGTQVIFCKQETSGKLIREILYRDMKERLERGDFG